MQFVYVVRRDRLFDDHYPHGFLPRRGNEEALARYHERARREGFFVERRHAERDPSLKQIIPYVVLRRPPDQVLLLRRSRRGGDARLYDKLSIGVGGHVEPIDAEAGDPILGAARREMDEEIRVEGEIDPVLVGCVNDDSNPVGAVHFGLVLSAACSGEVSVRESELLEARFESLETLRRRARDPESGFETWSSLILEGWEPGEP